MLAGMEQQTFVAGGGRHPQDGRDLHEVGPSAGDNEKFEPRFRRGRRIPRNPAAIAHAPMPLRARTARNQPNAAGMTRARRRGNPLVSYEVTNRSTSTA